MCSPECRPGGDPAPRPFCSLSLGRRPEPHWDSGWPAAASAAAAALRLTGRLTRRAASIESDRAPGPARAGSVTLLVPQCSSHTVRLGVRVAAGGGLVTCRDRDHDSGGPCGPAPDSEAAARRGSWPPPARRGGRSRQRVESDPQAAIAVCARRSGPVWAPPPPPPRPASHGVKTRRSESRPPGAPAARGRATSHCAPPL